MSREFLEFQREIEELQSLITFVEGIKNAYFDLKKKSPKSANDYKLLNELFKTIQQTYRKIGKYETIIWKRLKEMASIKRV